MSEIGNIIARYREMQGLSQRKLASLIGLSHGYLAKIEKGTENPSLETLKAIAEGLGIPVSKLLKDNQNNNFDWFYQLPVEYQEFLKDINSREYIRLAYFMYANKYPSSSVKGLLSLLWHFANKYSNMVSERKPNKSLLDTISSVSEGYFETGLKHGLYER
ncbi:helix-turn-helix domain-containing protein [Pelotomaculum propionicicum]|uniref:Transcriptional regulator ClgR n=1 Tax=Pelotomaculum propionicicum TaxID=258475 RepID=A0A4Y7RCA9_9FIRM|nr:helix-turn-helix transcriptional regulator [Pelotomaculum propionicicum]TEB06399.1 Transcriptional regulator ClgR [Pelotomaculum propionicicum]